MCVNGFIARNFFMGKQKLNRLFVRSFAALPCNFSVRFSFLQIAADFPTSSSNAAHLEPTQRKIS